MTSRDPTDYTDDSSLIGKGGLGTYEIDFGWTSCSASATSHTSDMCCRVFVDERANCLIIVDSQLL